MLDIILDEFHFSTLWNGGIFIYIGFVLILYFLLLPAEKKIPVWKQILFVLGMAAVFASLGSPINVIARIQFSTHIIQLILLLLVAPPLLIIGFKNEIFERAKQINFLNHTLNVLKKPVFGFILFFLIFYIYHIPAVFNYVRLDLFINYFFMLALLIAAILLWIPIISEKVMSRSRKMIYIVLSILLFVPYSILLFFYEGSLYLVYSDVDLFIQTLEACIPNLDGIPPEVAASLLPFDPEHEQFLGGLYLLIGQVLIFLAAAILSRKFTLK